MMENCLAALLTEFALHQDGTMALVDMLHDADSELYAKCAKPWVKRGLFVGTGGLDSTPRYAWNKIMIVRPCLIDDLGLHDTDEIVMFDLALAEYLQYLQLTAEVKRSNWGEFNRDPKRVVQLARVHSAAQNSLKLYVRMMKDLRHAKSQKDAEESSQQRDRRSRSRRQMPSAGGTAGGKKILSEFEMANLAGESSSSAAGEREVQS